MARVPFFQRVKSHIISQIESGRWAHRERIPSESALVEEMMVSRSTVSRALRELTLEGYLVRVQGVGSFVASKSSPSGLLEISNIADEIAERGGKHSADIQLLAEINASAKVAEALGLREGERVFHSIILHLDNGKPVQLADRYVNPFFAPDYLKQDFSRITPNQYLITLGKVSEAEHIIEAMMPDAKTRNLLEMEKNEPCLVLNRRAWSRNMLSSRSKLIYPASRTKLGARFGPGSHGLVRVL
ncbi:MAG: histidine utilization repressor [Deltaproteobacteria bacterium]|nr:histidine utilization repressor [Deltaproteobacteria bacterium]